MTPQTINFPCSIGDDIKDFYGTAGTVGEMGNDKNGIKVLVNYLVGTNSQWFYLDAKGTCLDPSIVRS